MTKVKVYLASPYTNGNQEENTKLQIKAGYELLELGYYPYLPLLTHYIQVSYPTYKYDWLDLDFAYLEVCDVLIRLRPKDKNDLEIPSPGADKEIKFAEENKIPIFNFETVEEMIEYLTKNPFETE
jgi:hypothetical protein